MQEPPITSKFSYLSNPCSVAIDSRGLMPQNPGPSTVPDTKFSPQAKAARSAAIAAIWKNGLPKNVSMISCYLQTKFYTLKNQHILIFARHYFNRTEDCPMKSNKLEYDQYYPNVMARYFPKAASLRLRLVKIKNATQESNEMTELGFDKEIEAGITELKNILEAETRHFFNDEILPIPIIPQKKLSQFEAKVEEIPIPQYRNNNSNNNNLLINQKSSTPISEFTSHQRQFDIKKEALPPRKQIPNGIKTYHSFTILPKNRLSNINIRQRRYKSQDEVNPEVIPITPQHRTAPTTFHLGNSSPDVYIVDEKITVRCPSAEIAAATTVPSFNPIQQQQMLQHRTPAVDPWQPYPPIISTTPPTQLPPCSIPYIPQRSSFIQPQQIQQIQQQPLSSPYQTIPDPYAFDFPSTTPPPEWKFQSCEDLLNEIKSEAAMFEKNREIPTKAAAPTTPTIISRNNLSGSNLDQNKPQQIRGTKRRESSGRTFCNGAKAIVSYFSLDGTSDSSVAKQQRRTASPFSELNAATTISAITAMP
uniref:Uncharacterized protein n=2 Tax=Panagrolaimus superbus TaxID=310955 RepID=A0A914YYA0_9BILA